MEIRIKKETSKGSSTDYIEMTVELLKKANERQKKCIYQFAKKIIGEG